MFALAETEYDRPEGALPDRWMIDPLDECSICGSITVSDVELLRIVLVAIETGARFQREGISLDPLAWMVAPRRMFGGAPPIEACIRTDACAKAVLVHGLGLDLDIDVEAIELLMEDDEDEPQVVSV